MLRCRVAIRYLRVGFLGPALRQTLAPTARCDLSRIQRDFGRLVPALPAEADVCTGGTAACCRNDRRVLPCVRGAPVVNTLSGCRPPFSRNLAAIGPSGDG